MGVDPLEHGAVDRLIVVTGILRSGTAALAQALHHLGIPMAVSMAPPSPPTWLQDWEDVSAMRFLAGTIGVKAITEGIRDEFREWIPHYLAFRCKASADMDRAMETRTAIIGTKSPLWLPFLSELAVAASRMGIEVTTIAMERPPEECRASIRTSYPARLHAAMHTTQDRLETDLGEAAHRFDRWQAYTDLCQGPAPELRNLAKLTGAPGKDFAKAASLIRRRSTPCHSPRA